MTGSREIDDLFDADGFLIEPELWDRDLALRIAAAVRVEELGEEHWAVIDYLRTHYLAHRTLPWEGNVCRELALGEACVEGLFGGLYEAWKVAGLPNPGEEARTYMLNQEPP